MIPRALTTTPLLAALAFGLAACGGGSGSSSSKSTPADVVAVIRSHYVNVADAKADAACNDGTVGYQNAFATTFNTSSCPAAVLDYRKRLLGLGSWTKQALHDVTVTGLKVSGATATAHVKLSNPSGGIDVPMGKVQLVRVGEQWMISNVLTD